MALEGPGALQSLVSIHFTSAELARQLLARPAMLYFVFGSSGVLVLVCHDLRQGVHSVRSPSLSVPSLPRYHLLRTGATGGPRMHEVYKHRCCCISM